MKIVGSNGQFTEEQLKTIKRGKLDNSKGIEISSEEFIAEAKELFENETESVERMIDRTS